LTFTMRNQPGVTRGGRQHGAEMVEASMILVPLLLMTFFVLDMGMGIFLQSTFQRAVRAGVRYGITGQNTIGPCADDSIRATVQRNALGFLGTAGGLAAIKVVWLDPDTGAAAASPANISGNILEVSIQGWQFNPFGQFQRVGSKLDISANSFDVMEPYPGAVPCITHTP